ncbi:helix-turn-helix domain-containing protein [Halomonas sp. AOP43-A1-21]
MDLETYRTTVKKIGPTAAAKELGVDYVRYWRWESGNSVPTADAIKKIKEWSNGEVTANDFIK